MQTLSTTSITSTDFNIGAFKLRRIKHGEQIEITRLFQEEGLASEPMAGLTSNPKQGARQTGTRSRETRETRPWNDVRRSGGDSPSTEGNARALQVSIAGVPLRLKSSHDEETVKELVRMVDEKIRQALPLTKTGSIQNASILAALNMAEELLLLKRRARELVDGLEARTARVIEDLEKSGPTA